MTAKSAKPIIGVNSDFDLEGAGRVYKKPYLFIYANYFEAIIDAGGIPVLLPFLDNEACLENVLSRIDGLLLGGCINDIDPSLYGEKVNPNASIVPRQKMDFDILLAKTTLKMKIPILGICSGMQLLNVAAGGNLIQHISESFDDCIEHFRLDKAAEFIHKIKIEQNSKLSEILQSEEIEVNSTHHQAIGTLAPSLKVTAKANDGVIEAIENEGEDFVVGVQWHPERLTRYHEQTTLFKALVNACQPSLSLRDYS